MQFFIKEPKSTYNERFARMMEHYLTSDDVILPDNLKLDMKSYYDMMAYWNEQRNDSIYTYFFVSDRDILYGAAKMTIVSKNEATLQLSVVPNKRNQGYGKMFMNLCRQQARELKINELILEVDAKAESVIAYVQTCGGVYKKTSFTSTGKRTMIYNVCAY